MTTDEQLSEWLKGKSIHNDERGECCPDFSCCKPELLAPEDERKAFVEGSEETRTPMLYNFLGRAMNLAAETKDKKVYLAGDPANENPSQ